MLPRHPSLCLLAGALLALGVAGQAWAAQPYEKSDHYQNPAIKAGGSLNLTNLVGRVSVEPATDGVLAIDSKVTAVAASGSDTDAQALAAKLRIEISVSGNNVTAVAHYPLDEYTNYYYANPDETGIMIGSSNSSVSYEGERVRVSSGTFGSGVNLHADFVVHVPKSVKVTVDNRVGKIEAGAVSAPLTLKSGSGDIVADGVSGDVAADTGSGDVKVTGETGALDLETGSGDVTVSRQKGGDVKLRTGSGDVKLTDVTGALNGETGSGDTVVENFTGDTATFEAGSGDIGFNRSKTKVFTLRTGSGEISLEDSSGSLSAHAGSGDIRASGFKSGESLDLHTGSGEVRLEGDLGAVLHLTAESGSGDINLHTSTIPSLHITATSDSGDVDVDLPGLQNVAAHSHSIRADVNGAKGTAELEAGSGDVNFTQH